MKFEIKLDLIKEYLRRLTISVQSVSSRVEFTGILITTYDNSITFEGRNDYMDTRIEETSLTDVKIMETGRVLIKANMLNEVIQKMEGSTVTFTKMDSNIITIDSDDSSYQMNLLTDENYDRATFMDTTDKLVKIPAKEFNKAISKVVFAGNDLHPKFIYQGLNVIIKDGVLSTTVCDGIRIASYKHNLTSDMSINKIVPLKVVRELIKILPSTEGEYKFYFAEDKGIVVSDNMINQFQLIEGTFPVFDKFFDQSIYTKQLTIKKDVLVNAIERATILIMNKADSSNRIVLEVNHDEFIIESREIELGTAKVEIKDHQYSGDPITVSVSPKVLQDGIKNSDSDSVKFFFTESQSSILMVSENDGLVYLLSPMV